MLKMSKKVILAFTLSLFLVTCVEEHVLPNFGHMFITSDPAGATVLMNGENTGKVTPAKFDELLAGDYTFTLKLESFVDTTLSIKIDEGKEYSEDIFLRETNPKGKIVLNSDPEGAQIWLDGINTGKVTPATFSNLQRGDYSFTLKLNLYEDHNITVSLNQNATVERNTKLVIAGTAGRIFVTSNPSGAAISLDGNPTGLFTPDTIQPVSAGEHTLTFSLNSYRDTTITTNVTAGDLTQESVDLTFYEPRGSISLDSEPQGARIFMNGENTGLLTPNILTKLEAGEYVIKLQLDSFFDTTFTVTVLEDQRTNVPIIKLTEVPFIVILSSNPVEGGTTSGGGPKNHGENITVVATPNEGYNFVNWTENSNVVSTNASYSFTVDRNRSLVANFELKIYTITATSNPSGSSGIMGAGEYKHGETVILLTDGNPGYQFINWTENGNEVSTNTSYSFTADRDRDLVANYNEIGNLVVNSDPGGADIYLDVNFTGEQTPYTFENILTGQYILTLKLEDFADTSIVALVNRNETTDVGTIFMRDITPPVNVNLDYRDNSGQIIFSFSFNQDVYLDRVEIIKPDGGVLSQNYGGQLVLEGRVIDLPYPEKLVGTWQFNFIGRKAKGRQASFNIPKNLVVN